MADSKVQALLLHVDKTITDLQFVRTSLEELAKTCEARPTLSKEYVAALRVLGFHPDSAPTPSEVEKKVDEKVDRVVGETVEKTAEIAANAAANRIDEEKAKISGEQEKAAVAKVKDSVVADIKEQVRGKKPEVKETMVKVF